MKLSISRDALLSQLQLVSRVASTRSAVQALSGVQLTATAGATTLRATDMEVGLVVPLDATLTGEGTVVLPGRLFLDVVRSLPPGEVIMEVRGGDRGVTLAAGGARFELRTLRAEDFPQFPDPNAESVTISATAFTETVEKVRRSASRDETRPILTGVLVSASGRELRMVATDSYRLSVKETQLERPLTADFEVNVPARALQEINYIVDHVHVESIAVSVRENQAVFQMGGVTLSSRLIDGKFPNYRQLLPDSFEHELRVDGYELAQVVARISLLAQKNAPLKLSFQPGELTVSAQTPDIGEASQTIPIPFRGDAFEIGFNPEYLRDGLESVGADQVVLKLISPLRPALIESADGTGFLYLIMPIRLNV